MPTDEDGRSYAVGRRSDYWVDDGLISRAARVRFPPLRPTGPEARVLKG